ncbi:hypothetical protein AMELA_G00108110 [Ameiurus melas]|uniref:Transmembrane protein 92 n=1 Tax=Ameiurus melas TaxID=219545 RepID=A0A7J6ASW0_AMEME|nr:hypothetical protein AMELA_G00108110 [Ameiurus melas]
MLFRLFCLNSSSCLASPSAFPGSKPRPEEVLQTDSDFVSIRLPAAGMMEMDYYYIKIFLTPLLGFSFAMLVTKCCCKHQCCSRSGVMELQNQYPSIYVIPFPVNDDNVDEGSLSSVAEFAPPAYDSVAPANPPPPYSERKVSVPDEEPPAYTEIVEEPSFILPPQTRHT